MATNNYSFTTTTRTVTAGTNSSTLWSTSGNSVGDLEITGPNNGVYTVTVPITIVSNVSTNKSTTTKSGEVYIYLDSESTPAKTLSLEQGYLISEMSITYGSTSITTGQNLDATGTNLNAETGGNIVLSLLQNKKEYNDFTTSQPTSFTEVAFEKTTNFTISHQIKEGSGSYGTDTNGYFSYNTSNITYTADTTIGSNKYNLTIPYIISTAGTSKAFDVKITLSGLERSFGSGTYTNTIDYGTYTLEFRKPSNSSVIQLIGSKNLYLKYTGSTSSEYSIDVATGYTLDTSNTTITSSDTAKFTVTQNLPKFTISSLNKLTPIVSDDIVGGGYVSYSGNITGKVTVNSRTESPVTTLSEEINVTQPGLYKCLIFSVLTQKQSYCFGEPTSGGVSLSVFGENTTVDAFLGAVDCTNTFSSDDKVTGTDVTWENSSSNSGTVSMSTPTEANYSINPTTGNTTFTLPSTNETENDITYSGKVCYNYTNSSNSINDGIVTKLPLTITHQSALIIYPKSNNTLFTIMVFSSSGELKSINGISTISDTTGYGFTFKVKNTILTAGPTLNYTASGSISMNTATGGTTSSATVGSTYINIKSYPKLVANTTTSSKTGTLALSFVDDNSTTRTIFSNVSVTQEAAKISGDEEESKKVNSNGVFIES